MTETKAPEPRFGRCLNEGRCDLADSNARIPLAPEAELTCPSCHMPVVVRAPAGKPLVETEEPRKPLPRRLLIFGGVVATAIIAGFAFNLFEAPEEPEEAQAATEMVPPAEEIGDPLSIAGRRTNIMLFTLGATPETRDRLAPALAAAFMESNACTSVSEQRISGDKLRLGCDKKDIRFYIDIAPTEGATAFDKRVGRQIDLLLTTDRAAGLQPRDPTTIGFAAAAVVVNPANSLRSLTLPQLAAVFGGETESFSAVGGPNAGIRRIAGRDGDAEVAAFKASVPGGGKLAISTRRLADSPAVATAVAGDPDAIALVNPVDIGSTRALAIKGAGEAVLPSPAAIADGRYPLAQRLRIEIPRGSKIRFARPFAEFATTTDAQAVVKGAGYLPLPPGAARREKPPAEAPAP